MVERVVPHWRIKKSGTKRLPVRRRRSAKAVAEILIGPMPPAVPSFEDPNFITALSSLVQAAAFLRDLVGVMAAEGSSGRSKPLMHADMVLLSEAVVQRFEEHMASLHTDPSP